MKKVENFDDYTELARPLPERESRVFDAGTNGTRVDYGSFQLALAQGKVAKEAVILVEHGCGKFVFRIESQWIALPALLAVAESDPRALYALLFTLYKGQEEAATAARVAMRYEMAEAFLHGRLKKRKKNGSYKVWIEPKEER